MSRTEELAMLLRVEGYFCQHYSRQYQKNVITYDAACAKIKRCIGSVRKWKSLCVQELDEEDYPEEFFFPEPEIPPKKSDFRTENEHQLSLFDFGGFADE